MMSKHLKIGLLILLVSGSGCRMIAKQFAPKFLTGKSAQTAAQAVKNKIGVAFRVQTVEISEDTFKMKIETPGNPKNIDEYTYLGVGVSGPEPVRRDAMTDSREKIPFDEIDFTVIPQIAQKALDKTQLEGGAVLRMTLQAQDGRPFRWFVEVQGTRERASVNADPAGNITSTDQSQTTKAADYQVLNEAELTRATDALKARFGEQVRYQKITFDDKSVMIYLVNPQNLKMIDTYSFGVDGLKRSPLPSIPAMTGLTTGDFPLISIEMTDAAGLPQKAKDRLAMPDGKLFSITYEQKVDPIAKISQLTWAVWIKQGTNEGTVYYDAKLNEISVSKD